MQHFLGFKFICDKSSRGYFTLKRKSRRDRTRAKPQEVKKELRRRMHQPIPEQGKWLRPVVTGYFAHGAVPTNVHALTAFRFHIANLWPRTPTKGSQKDQTTWDRITNRRPRKTQRSPTRVGHVVKPLAPGEPSPPCRVSCELQFITQSVFSRAARPRWRQ
jgi:hypothetical protein